MELSGEEGGHGVTGRRTAGGPGRGEGVVVFRLVGEARTVARAQEHLVLSPVLPVAGARVHIVSMPSRLNLVENGLVLHQLFLLGYTFRELGSSVPAQGRARPLYMRVCRRKGGRSHAGGGTLFARLASARRSSRSRTTSTWPFMEAVNSAVVPSCRCARR